MLQPEIVLSAISPISIDFIPRLAQRQNTGLISGGIALEIDTTDRIVLVTRSSYGGKMREIRICKEASPQIILLAPSTFPPPILDNTRQSVIEKV